MEPSGDSGARWDPADCQDGQLTDPAERRRLRAWLAERGADAEQLDRAESLGHLAGLAAELVLTEGAALSANDVAARAGVDAKGVAEMFRHFGVAVGDLDTPQFTEVDARIAAALCHVELPEMAGGELPRVVASAMDRIAEAAVALYVQGPQADQHRSGAGLQAVAEKTEHATRMALDLGTALGGLFRHHMAQAIERQRVITEGVSRRELARLAVGFVDLVGSTAIEAGLDPGELAAMVSRFESRAFEVTAAGGGRLVKFIGDEIMVAALDPLSGCRIIGSLVDAFNADGLRPRAGLVYGEVLYRHGDYYGPVVNLAARLVDEAIPDEVLVDRSVVDAVGPAGPVGSGDGGIGGPRFAPAGRRLLKGFDEPVVVWSLEMP
jgi:adenylate cyclase